MARIKVQIEDFDIGAEFAALTVGRTDIGGIGCFVGTVRNNALEQRVTAMTLEHYPAMTEHTIARVIEEAEGRWELLGCTVIHRVGRLVAGDNIVLVLAAAAHRQAALDATAFLIDWLKTKEFANGAAEWVEAREADNAAAARW
jgi:molybdopterin synthase catalytic subunit